MLLLLGLNSAEASNVGVDLNVNIGNQPPPVIIRERSAPPPRVIVTEPGPYESPDYYEDDVEFMYPGRLGFYVGVGVPFDLFYINNVYFSYRNGGWYRAHNHRGPWTVAEYRHLPYGLRKHKIERIRYYRDHEYKEYRRDHDNYRGRHARIEKGEWKEYRKDARNHAKEDRRYEKERRKDDRRMEKEYRKEGRGEGHGKHDRD